MADSPRTPRLALRPGDIELTAEQLRRTPLFAGAPRSVDRRLNSLRAEGAMVMRLFRAGELITRQGEPGWTAFYLARDADVRSMSLPPIDHQAPKVRSGDTIDPNSATKAGFLLQGASDLPRKAEVFIAPGDAKARVVKPSGLTRLGDLFLHRVRRKQLETTTTAVVPSDDELGSLIAYLREGEVFGELSCFTHAPRSASVRAMEDCYVVEMLGNVLEIALENERFKETLDEIFRKRSLQSAIAGIPLFEEASAETLAKVRRRCELRSYEAGDVVYAEGDPTDAIYLVRMGTLELTHTQEGRSLRYASRGESLGLAAMLRGTPQQEECRVHVPRDDHSESSRRALGSSRVELIRIPKRAVDDAMFEDETVAENAERLREEQTRQASMSAPTRAMDNLAGALGLLQAQKVMLIDLDTCTRCNDCVKACADTHGGVPRLVRQGPRFGNFLVPDTCRQCREATCLVGCPVRSIHRGPDREIVIEDWCIGCGLCAENCPYNAIEIVPRGPAKVAVTCDQCASISSGTPMCVYACGVGAARRVEGHEFFGSWDDDRRRG